MHFQYPPAAETKLVRCTRGAILDVIVDLRPESPTFLQHASVELTADNRRSLYVPQRFAHGYQVLEDGTEVAYLTGRATTRRSTKAACRTTIRGWRSRGRCRRPTCRTATGAGRRSTQSKPTIRARMAAGAAHRGPARDHRRRGAARPRGERTPDPHGHDRRRLHGPRRRQPGRQPRHRACGCPRSTRGAWTRRVDGLRLRHAGLRARRGAARRTALDRAIEAGRPVVTDDPFLLCRSPHLDALMDVTGAIELGAQVALETFEHGKHLVLMNAELDATLGPILRRLRAAARRDRVHLRRRSAGRADQPAPVRHRDSGSCPG